MIKFRIEQVAICPPNPAAAIELLTALGAGEWAHDIVTAAGDVRADDMAVHRVETSKAALAFNYEMDRADDKPLEFEVLHYIEGRNWMDKHPHAVSHLGMHCKEKDLPALREFFANRNIRIAQELVTREHTNPAIKGKRWYRYVIFDTRAILGVDLKFIVRNIIKK